MKITKEEAIDRIRKQVVCDENTEFDCRSVPGRENVLVVLAGVCEHRSYPGIYLVWKDSEGRINHHYGADSYTSFLRIVSVREDGNFLRVFYAYAWSEETNSERWWSFKYPLAELKK